MTSIVQIGAASLAVLEYEGQRVVTLAMVDTVHERPEGTAGRNFRENRERFIQAEDFYELTSDEIRRQSFGQAFPPRTPKGLVLTESGYMMLVKSFNDDLAWDVQRKLVKSYFRPVTVAPVLALPDFTDPGAAARAWAEQFDKSRALAIERDQAISTKALIGSRREATAMNTAAQKSKEAAKLRDQLGFSARHATVLQVEAAMGRDFPWHPLRKYCKEQGLAVEVVPDKRFPNGVKAWPAKAWAAVYQVCLEELFGEEVPA